MGKSPVYPPVYASRKQDKTEKRMELLVRRSLQHLSRKTPQVPHQFLNENDLLFQSSGNSQTSHFYLRMNSYVNYDHSTLVP